MGIRQALRGKQGALVALGAVMIAAAGIAIWWQLRDDGAQGTGLYYTTDDGTTIFVDDSVKMPPFDKDGKPALRAHVFECGGKRVVGYLSRYTEQAKRAFDEAMAYKGTGKAPPNARELASLGTRGIEVKRPGDGQWVSQADAARATRIRVFKCPDGAAPQEVYP